MKKLTIILTAIVWCMAAMVSCEPMTQQQIDADMAACLTEFNYKGHRYLLYKQDYNGGITHDPDCPCNKKGGPNDAK